MRQLLAVAILGASLAVTAGSAFAGDNTDYNYAPLQQTQTVTSQDQSGSAPSAVAGEAAPKSVYGDSRYENIGN